MTKTTKDIKLPVEKNTLLETTLAAINQNLEIKTLWKVINVHAIKRLGMTDHGPVHFQIVASNALKMSRLLTKAGIELSIAKDFKLTQDHGEVVIVLASLLHDLGMSINRKGHEELSLFLTHTFLREVLSFLPVDDRTIVIAETLHAIISHRKDGEPLTIEAGIVRIADALDMTKGRSRIPYEAGEINIHSVSAMAIDEIEITAGKKTPVEIAIVMNHTAGLFQVDELLKKKVTGSGIEKHFDITVFVDKGKGRQLFKQFFKAA